MNLAYKHDIRLCQRFNKLIIAYLLGIRHHVRPVRACPVAVHLVHMRHDARKSLCLALYGLKVTQTILSASYAHTLHLRFEVTENGLFLPRRGSYVIECHQSFHIIDI